MLRSGPVAVQQSAAGPAVSGPHSCPACLLAACSAAEKAGLSLSKIEKLGLLSTAERLGLLTLAEDLLTSDPGKISSGGWKGIAVLLFIVCGGLHSYCVGGLAMPWGGGRPADHQAQQDQSEMRVLEQCSRPRDRPALAACICRPLPLSTGA